MRSLLLYSISAILLINTSFINCRKDCITFIKATSQSWIAGIKNGGKGTNYVITCIAGSSSDKLKIEKLLIGSSELEAKVVKDPDVFPGDGNFSAGDTIYVLASRFISSTGKDESQVSSAKKHKGEALLSYRCGSKMKYLSIPSFEVLERLNMP